MILPRETVRAAYQRALALHDDHDAAVLALGVDPALVEQITAAYRRLRSERHPDRGGSTAAFDEVERAYRAAQEQTP